MSKRSRDFPSAWHGEEQLVIFSAVKCQRQPSSTRVFQSGWQGQKFLRNPGAYTARLAQMTEVG